MAYRRKQGIQRSATFVEDHRQPSPGDSSSPAIASPRATRFADDSRRPDCSLAAHDMLASTARGDMRAFAAERFPASSPQRDVRPSDPAQDPITQLHTSMSGSNDDPKYEPSKKDEAKHGFWGVLAQQAKVMLDENGSIEDGRNQALGSSGGIQPSQSRWSYDRVRKSENSTLQKGSEGGKLDIGGKIKNVLEEGLTTMAENRTGAEVLHARRLQIRRKACSMDFRNTNLSLASPDMSPMLNDLESPQIKASRDVANAMAAKVKLLQRELKTVKADLAFSKERCAQLEEENRLHRDGNHDADEDLIRQQLETLLAEKGRLAHENTVYARENWFLREIVEFHQLNMQDVVNLDEDIEEEDEEDAGTDWPYDDLWTLLPSCGQVQEAAEHTPASPGSASHAAEHTPASPGSASHSPSRYAGKEGMSRTKSGAIHAESSPMRRSFKGDDGSPETTPMRRSFKDDNGSPKTTTPMRRSFNDDNGSPGASPMRRSFKDHNGSPEASPMHRSFKDDNGSPEASPMHRSFKDDDGSPGTTNDD